MGCGTNRTPFVIIPFVIKKGNDTSCPCDYLVMIEKNPIGI